MSRPISHARPSVRRAGGAITWVALLGMVLLVGAGCSGDGDADKSGTPTKAGRSEVKSDAFDPAKGVVLDEAGGGAGEQLCAAISAKDLAKIVSADFDAGQVTAPMGAACTWEVRGGDGPQVSVQIVPAEYYSPPSAVDGFQELDGIADEAAGVPDGEGYQVWARVGERGTVVVSTDAGKSHQDEAVALMREVLKLAFP